MVWILLVALLGLAGVVGWHLTNHPAKVTVPAPAPVALQSVPRRDPNALAAPLPTVRGTSYRDWITNYTHHASWADIIRVFYGRLTPRKHIATYFVHVDMPILQAHFAKAMIMVTSTGLTWGVVEAMREVHANIRAEDGTPITGAIFDEVVDVLVKVLQDYKIPTDAIGELALVVPPLREAIVQEV